MRHRIRLLASLVLIAGYGIAAAANCTVTKVADTKEGVCDADCSDAAVDAGASEGSTDFIFGNGFDWHACTLASGGALYSIPAASHYDESQASNLTGAGNGDYLSEDGWWFRVAGDPFESFFPTPTTTSCAGAAGRISWSDVDARGLFSAVNTLAISSAATNAAQLVLTMSVMNLSTTTPLVISLFHGADLDVNGTGGGDSATRWVTLDGTYWIEIRDATAGAAIYSASPPASAFLVRPYGTTTDVFGELFNTTITNFDSTGLPADSIDFTGGYQWNLTIPAGATHSVSVGLYPRGALSSPICVKTGSEQRTFRNAGHCR